MSLRPYLVLSAPSAGVSNAREVLLLVIETNFVTHARKMRGEMQWGTPPLASFPGPAQLSVAFNLGLDRTRLKMYF